MKKKEYLNQLNQFRTNNQIFKDIDSEIVELKFESLKDFNIFHDYKFVCKWFTEIRLKNKMNVKNITFNECENWSFNKKKTKFQHDSGHFYYIESKRVFSGIREVNNSYWDQPFITQVGYDGGIIGLIRKRFDGIPHYLCEAKSEPGNYKIVQLSPSLQATFSNIYQKHKGRAPYFSKIFLNANKRDIIFNKWFSEDGGRLFNKRNKGILINYNKKIENIPKNFIWLSLWQIKKLIYTKNAIVNPHLRSLVSFI